MRIRAEGRKSGQDREDGDAQCDSVTRLGRHAYSGNHKTVPKRRLSHCFAFAAIAKGGMREMRGVFIIGKTLCLCIKCFLCVFSDVTLSQYRGPHMNLSFSPSRPVAADTLAFVLGNAELTTLPLSASKTVMDWDRPCRFTGEASALFKTVV